MATRMLPGISMANLYTAVGILPVSNGGTGASTAAGARANLGVGTGNGNAEILDVSFDYTSTSPVAIGLLNVGDIVEAAEIEVLTAFNGGSPTASIGTATDVQRFVTSTPLSSVTLQSSEGGVSIGSAVNAILTLSLGGSTTGSGRISLTVSRA